ncbi:hypothetical protein AB0M87_26735 [Streptomyces sp. NPDC051320]|uniref:hypothetical protein n=1 Tax=Streptomyces sp. NPDC051320 TaxID=3154644 RepID=UPI003430E199
MTQNGQGDEPQLPAARRAHEGVVMPADGSGPYVPEVAGEHTVPAGGRPWGQAWGPQDAQPQPPQYQAPYQQAAPQPLPHAQPLPPEAVPGAGDGDATQYIAPVSLPPENPAESTQFLGYPQQPAPGPAGSDADPTQFLPPVPAAPAAAPYGIRPGAPEDRQPPAEFDSLFRTDGGGAGPQAAGETQQLPRFDPQQPYGNDPYAQPPYQQPPQARPPHQPYQQQPPAQPYASQPPPPVTRAAAGDERRRSSRTPLIAAVVVGCAVLGLGAGALLSGGGSGDKKDDKEPVAATSAEASKSPQAAADPAKPQAVSLDKLLGDSNSSRSAVIAAVGNIRSCQNLPKAAADLRDAAKQRRGLVTRLGALAVDKLPNNAQLSASLTKGWNASATADEQYAAWAQKVAAAGKKGCKHGHAKRTAEAGRGDRASGEATAAKKQASTLWNGIADKYSLTERRGDQL